MVKKSVKKVAKKGKAKNSKKITKKIQKKKTISKKTIKKSKPAIKPYNAKKYSLEEVEWDESMSVEEKTIDSQHKKLVEEIRLLEEEMKADDSKSLETIRKTIHFLDGYIKKHFTYEESYMQKINFPGYKKHKLVHDNFIEFYQDLKKELMIKITEEKDVRSLAKDYLKKVHKFIAEWTINHIVIDDQEYHDYVRNKKKVPKEKTKEKTALSKKSKIDISEIAAEIKAEQVKEQRPETLTNIPIQDHKEGSHKDSSKGGRTYIKTGIEGFDELLEEGIPQGNSMLVAGGAGSGKTIFCMQSLAHHAMKGKKCLIMTLEEREERLIQHMEDFGWPAKKLVKKGNLRIKRINPFEITRNVDALLAQQRGELLIKVDPVILPKDFKDPDFIVIDSLTAIASAFTGKDESYRIYIEQLFRFLEKTKSTSFLITETEQVPKVFSPSGVEEFLADGVVVLYALKHGNVRENAIEILKLRGAAHQKKIVAMQITGQGVVVYPEQEVFSEFE